MTRGSGVTAQLNRIADEITTWSSVATDPQTVAWLDGRLTGIREALTLLHEGAQVIPLRPSESTGADHPAVNRRYAVGVLFGGGIYRPFSGTSSDDLTVAEQNLDLVRQSFPEAVLVARYTSHWFPVTEKDAA